MRQKDDSTFTNILNSLRVGQLSANNIEILKQFENYYMTGNFAYPYISYK